MFQYLYDFPLSTNQLIKKIGFQLYFGSCLLIVRSCLRGWEPEETPLSARISRSLSVSVRGRSLWSKIVLLLPVEEVMWWWKWRGECWERREVMRRRSDLGGHRTLRFPQTHRNTQSRSHQRENKTFLFFKYNRKFGEGNFRFKTFNADGSNSDISK